MPVHKDMRPLTEDERSELMTALEAVPTRTVVHRDWTTPAGVEALARLSAQLKISGWPHVSEALFPDAEDMNKAVDFLRSALLYQARAKRRRGR